MIVRILAVGRARGTLAQVVAEYENRARHYWKLEVTEIAAGTSSAKSSAAEVREAEGARIVGRPAPDESVVALTRGGRPMDSTAMAGLLEKAALESVRAVTFIVGGAFGLSDTVLKASRRRLSVSHMTLPHDMARLILTEQIYRAGTIRRGEPYHKGAP